MVFKRSLVVKCQLKEKSQWRYCITNMIYFKTTLRLYLASILMLFFTVQIFKENKLVRILVNTMHVIIYYLRCTRLLWRHVEFISGMRLE
jgi:hypothetical protein